jgi:biotin carboxyl carrier protein
MVKQLKITVEGKVYDVIVEDVTEDAGSNLYPAPGMSQAASAPRVAAAAPVAAAPAAAPASAGAGDQVAPLGGVIVEVNVKAGDAVKTGDQVAIIEAMKMKTVVASDHAGTVSNVMIKVGDAVDAGQPLMTIG